MPLPKDILSLRLTLAVLKVSLTVARFPLSLSDEIFKRSPAFRAPTLDLGLDEHQTLLRLYKRIPCELSAAECAVYQINEYDKLLTRKSPTMACTDLPPNEQSEITELMRVSEKIMENIKQSIKSIEQINALSTLNTTNAQAKSLESLIYKEDPENNYDDDFDLSDNTDSPQFAHLMAPFELLRSPAMAYDPTEEDLDWPSSDDESSSASSIEDPTDCLEDKTPSVLIMMQHLQLSQTPTPLPDVQQNDTQAACSSDFKHGL